MAKKVVSDELWSIVEPLLPPPTPKPRGGRPPISNRDALTGILMELRELLKNDADGNLKKVLPLNIPDFLLLGCPIAPVYASSRPSKLKTPQRLMF